MIIIITQNQINQKETIFLIIDLPGREDIVKTYISPYYDNLHIKNLMKTNNLTKLFMTSLYLNPLAIGIFDPDTLLNYFNKNLITRQSMFKIDKIFYYKQ